MPIFLAALLALAFALSAMPSSAENAKHVAQLIRTKICPSCDLRKAKLRNADLQSADLSGADLRRAWLYGAKLSGAWLTGADLSRASLRRANLENLNLVPVKLRKTLMPDGHVNNRDC